MTITWKKLSYSDHTHGNATTSGAGFLSTTDKSKLDGIASGATNYSHPTGDGNLHVPANGTTNAGKVLTATASAGVYTWQASTASGTGSGVTAGEVNTLLVNRELTQAIFTPVSWETAPYIAPTTTLDPDSYNFMIMWVGKLDEWVLGSDRALFTKEQLVSGADLVFGIKSTSGQLFLDVIGNYWGESDNGLTISDALYHCLAVTYSKGPTQTTIKFFVDGYQLGNDQVFNNIGAISPAGKLYISGYSWATIRQITSKVYYYNRAPSSDEMLSIYLLGVDPADVGANKTTLGNYSSLVQGSRYRIISYAAGDDFSYVGAANVTGTEFVAIEQWPTVWEHGSVVTRIGAMLQLEPAGIFKSHWSDFTDTYSVVYPSNITFTKRTPFDDSLASNIVFGGTATSGISNYPAHADHTHGVPIVDVLSFTCIAGENLNTNDLVFIATPYTDLTAGRAYECSNNDIYKSVKAWVVGFVKTSTVSGASVTIQRTGVVSGFTNLTPGRSQYLGFKGSLTEVPTSNSLIAGISISSTQLLVTLTTEIENVLTWYPKGYAMGGYTGAPVATTDKITFSTDTTVAQTSGNLSVNRQYVIGVSADTKGYAMGGYTASAFVATTDKITYATDITAAQTSGNLSSNRGFGSGVSADTKGYAMGGYTGGQVSITDKITFSTDTTIAQTTGNLSQNRGFSVGVSADTKGYSMGGTTGNGVANTDRIMYSNDTTVSQTSGNLSVARAYLTGISADVKGYAMGGNTTSNYATTDKITYATDITAAQTTANLPTAKSSAAGVSADTKGYVMGGDTGAATFATDRIIFATDITTSRTTANVTQARYYSAGVSGFNQASSLSSIAIVQEPVLPWRATKGYAMGGSTGAAVATTDMITYASDATIAKTTANLSGIRWGVAGVSADIKGYAMGGYSTVSAVTTDKITYATDTRAAQASGNLSQARYYSASISADTKGYVLGGNTGAAVATTDRIIYSTDTTAAQTTANLSVVKYGGIGISADVKGYVMGGISSGYTLTTEKINYSTDTITAQTSANLSLARYSGAGVSADTKGYVMGGYSNAANTAVTDKITYSTDITAAQASGNLSQARAYSAGVSADFKGYAMGGNTAAGVITTDKITYITDTTAAQASGNLSQARSGVSGISDFNAAIALIAASTVVLIGTEGFVMGGMTDTNYVATTHKIIYATETTVAQTSANLTQARSSLGGVSADTKGYALGGVTGSNVTTTDKIVYSTDITAAQASGNLSQARASLASISGDTKGYIMGGATATAVATADKITYSTDTTVAQTSANLTQARYNTASVSDETKGYAMGGTTGSLSVVVTNNKITYATDTTVAQTSGNLVTARFGAVGISSSTKGYVLGGYTGDVSGITDKITYSTDTTVAQTSGNLSQARYNTAAVSADIKGYVLGGFTASASVATADMITYSTDMTGAKTSANLPQAKYGAATVSDYNVATRILNR